MDSLDLNPRHVTASNLIFVRTRDEKTLGKEAATLAEQCWPFHRTIIDGLEKKAILCFGNLVGRFVRERLGAHEFVDEYIEDNARQWRSTAHQNSAGIYVLNLRHPA